MSEKVFRGIRMHTSIPNNWVKGGFYRRTDYYGEEIDKYYIVDGSVTNLEGYGEDYEIFPSTLCQYIGRNDTHGNQIFENDIVLCAAGEGFLGHREFEETILVDDITNYQTMIILQEAGDLTILGNKFDNPELLKWWRNVPDLKEE